MKQIKTTCDRCNKEIGSSNEMVRDFIDRKFPNIDICEDCYLQIEAAKVCSTNDLINNFPLGTSLKKMVDSYT